MTQKEKREMLAKADFCRAFLHIQGFLTGSESEKIFQRIRKWQYKHKVGITDAQLWSVEVSYDDNANDTELGIAINTVVADTKRMMKDESKKISGKPA